MVKDRKGHNEELVALAGICSPYFGDPHEDIGWGSGAHECAVPPQDMDNVMDTLYAALVRKMPKAQIGVKGPTGVKKYYNAKLALGAFHS